MFNDYQRIFVTAKRVPVQSRKTLSSGAALKKEVKQSGKFVYKLGSQTAAPNQNDEIQKEAAEKKRVKKNVEKKQLLAKVAPKKFPLETPERTEEEMQKLRKLIF